MSSSSGLVQTCKTTRVWEVARCPMSRLRGEDSGHATDSRPLASISQHSQSSSLASRSSATVPGDLRLGVPCQVHPAYSKLVSRCEGRKSRCVLSRTWLCSGQIEGCNLRVHMDTVVNSAPQQSESKCCLRGQPPPPRATRVISHVVLYQLSSGRKSVLPVG